MLRLLVCLKLFFLLSLSHIRVFIALKRIWTKKNHIKKRRSETCGNHAHVGTEFCDVLSRTRRKKQHKVN